MRRRAFDEDLFDIFGSRNHGTEFLVATADEIYAEGPEDDNEDDHDEYDDAFDCLLRDPEERFTYGVGFSWVTLATVTTYLPTKLKLFNALSPDAIGEKFAAWFEQAREEDPDFIIAEINSRHIQAAVRFILGPSTGIVRHAISEGTRACTRLYSRTDTDGRGDKKRRGGDAPTVEKCKRKNQKRRMIM